MKKYKMTHDDANGGTVSIYVVEINPAKEGALKRGRYRQFREIGATHSTWGHSNGGAGHIHTIETGKTITNTFKSFEEVDELPPEIVSGFTEFAREMDGILGEIA